MPNLRAAGDENSGDAGTIRKYKCTGWRRRLLSPQSRLRRPCQGFHGRGTVAEFVEVLGSGSHAGGGSADAVAAEVRAVAALEGVAAELRSRGGAGGGSGGAGVFDGDDVEGLYAVFEGAFLFTYLMGSLHADILWVLT